jgi:hypothetical protein
MDFGELQLDTLDYNWQQFLLYRKAQLIHDIK